MTLVQLPSVTNLKRFGIAKPLQIQGCVMNLALKTPSIAFGQSNERFIDISNLDCSESDDDRSDEGDFIIGEHNH